MIRSIVILIALFTALSALLISSPQAEAGKATDAVRSASETMASLLRKKTKNDKEEKQLAAKVTKRLRNFLDVDELGKLALTDHWAKINDKQQTEYLELLRALIEANYIRGLRANLRYTVTYDGESKKDDRMVVTTRVHTKRGKRRVAIEIEYLLRFEKGVYRAVDVITDGAGLVENYRAQFNRIISKEGFDGLLKRMRKKLAAL